MSPIRFKGFLISIRTLVALRDNSLEGEVVITYVMRMRYLSASERPFL